jgi:hypothetical protein
MVIYSLFLVFTPWKVKNKNLYLVNFISNLYASRFCFRQPYKHFSSPVFKDPWFQETLFACEYHGGYIALRDHQGLYLSPIGSRAVLKTRSNVVTKVGWSLITVLMY